MKKNGNVKQLGPNCRNPTFRECEDETHILEMGIGNPLGLPKLQNSIAGVKNLKLWRSLYHWKAIEV